ncbi:HNH endonuclease [Hymenobacter sp. ISL-91]|uniref:HNH endonuclease signature motif containing protein n=1 Tax=Hymenobacter sp. ISL-91 TaxID=2819151 RepID=UPI001BE73E1A|nr:HNH endonuclease signature motif containing protein [Hymenobacter sp. ISL-91]MBT2558258.1 HNH endonuclease [Hymenobacter sp. ISL-91]
MENHTNDLAEALHGAVTHPEYPDYRITPAGLIYDQEKAKWAVLGTTPRGHLEVWLRQADGQRKRVKVHRIVAQAFLPPIADKAEVDHLDQNVQNNAVENLVWADRSDQMRNRQASSKGTSQYIGVSFNSTRGQWVAKAKAGGKTHSFGYHDDEESAARARDAGATALGFTYMNLPA